LPVPTATASAARAAQAAAAHEGARAVAPAATLFPTAAAAPYHAAAAKAAPAVASAAPRPGEAAKASGREALRAVSAELSKKGADAGRTLGRFYAGGLGERSSEAPVPQGTAGTLSRPRLDPARPRTAELVAPGGRPLAVELAVTEAELQRGMSHRSEVPADGLLFVPPGEGDSGYLHKNVLVPVDYVFLDSKGAVASVAAAVPAAPPGSPWHGLRLIEGGRHRFALVVPAGRAEALGPLIEAMPSSEMWRLLSSEDEQAPAALHGALLERPGAEDAFFELVPYAQKVLSGLPRASAFASRVRANLRSIAEAASRGESLGEHAATGLIANAFPEVWAQVRGVTPAWKDLPLRLLSLAAAPLRLYAWLQVFAHELGHWTAGWLLGAQPDALRVWRSGGGVTTFKAMPEAAWKRVLISLAGPAAEVLLSLAFLAAGAAFWTWTMPELAAALRFGGVGALFSAPQAWMWGAGALFTFNSLNYLLNAPAGWSYDLVYAAWDLGFKRMAQEMDWRRRRMADDDAPSYYYPHMLLQLLLPGSLNRQRRWDAPRRGWRQSLERE
ncbi:MAG: M50 family metallopeptidase, partial [Elusimicrobia bacterium]|nr:M50 family metallopeptidase [Elusimicrobiota bacterium]